jgi:hypothetical protein
MSIYHKGPDFVWGINVVDLGDLHRRGSVRSKRVHLGMSKVDLGGRRKSKPLLVIRRVTLGRNGKGGRIGDDTGLAGVVRFYSLEL